MVKICPTCGAHNDMANTLCEECMTDISSVTPVEDSINDASIPENDSGATVIERRKFLSFEASDGSGRFIVADNAIIGRENEGKEYLAKYMTVSRRHARLTYSDSWFIEDLNSANGTYLNAKRLEQGEKAAIKSGDFVALSHSCIFKIKE